MNNADYWRQRAQAVEAKAHCSAEEFAERAAEEFDKASARLQKDIADWYRRFSTNNEISLAEAKRLLNTRELKEFRWTVEDYINAAQSIDPDNLDKALMKQLENASARVHISRLEAIQTQLQAEAELLYGNQTDELTRHLTSIYEDGYYRTAFTIQQGVGVGWSFSRIDEKAIEKALSEPWTADNITFRDKCWTYKSQLSSELRTQLTQGIIRGDNPIQMADNIAKRFNVSKSKSTRLCYTESAHISALSQRDCYKELEVERFEIIETLDSITCPTCGSLDGTVLPMSQYEVGVTVPPFHPHCRGCTCPYFEDLEGERIARNERGDTYYVPGDMTYAQWKKSVVDILDKEELIFSKALTETASTGIIKIAFENSELLTKHYEKHRLEFGNISEEDYLLKANELANCALSNDVVQLIRSDGSIAKYRFSTNEFLVLNKDGTIRTFFKPKGKGAYWEYEIERNQ